MVFDEETYRANREQLELVRLALTPYDTGRQYLNFTEEDTDPARSTRRMRTAGCARSRRSSTRKTSSGRTTRSGREDETRAGRPPGGPPIVRADERPDDRRDHRRVGPVGEVGVAVEHADLGAGDRGRRGVRGFGHDRHAVGPGQQQRRRGDPGELARAGRPSPPRPGTRGGWSGRRRAAPAKRAGAEGVRSLVGQLQDVDEQRRRSPRLVARGPAPPRSPSIEPGGYGSAEARLVEHEVDRRCRDSAAPPIAQLAP